MGKNNNLKDFVTDIADAIREKKGTTGLINPQDFSNEIKGIEGGSPEAGYNDITFFDYDGKIVYSYTWDEFVAKNELPPMPQHRGLTSIEWNWTVEDILEQPNHKAFVGLLVKPDDDSCRMVICAFGEVEIDLIAPTEGLTINWGDGVVESYEEGTITMKHHYSKMKEYDVRVKSNGDNRVAFGHGTSQTNAFFRGNGKVVEVNWHNCALSQGCMYSLKVKKLSMTGIVIHNLAILSDNCIQCIVIDKKINTNNYWGQKESMIYIGRNNTNISNSGADRINMPWYSAPKGMTEIGYGGIGQSLFTYVDLTNNPNLRLLGITCQYCSKLITLLLPENLTSIPSGIVLNCISLKHITIPPNITIVKSQAFMGCVSLPKVDFSKVNTVPSLENVDAFNNTTCKIIVPDNLYDEWIIATNWNTLVDRIVKASEYVEPTND